MDKSKITTIVLIDSVDKRSKEIERENQKFTKEVIFCVMKKNEPDFARARNMALEKVTTEWAFFLDSDEKCSPQLWAEIHSIIEQDRYDALLLPRRDYFLGKLLKHGETGKTQLLRIARTKIGAKKWHRPVHETWDVSTKKICLTKNILHHFPHPTLSEFIQKLNWYASLEPKSRRHKKYSLAKILFELFFFPLGKFIQNYLFRRGYADSWQGFIHAFCMSYYSLIVRIFLYESQYE